jgi:hypothetical protein
VGASLSRIAILSDVVARQVGEQMPKGRSFVEGDRRQRPSVMDEMNDAVWFIDPDIRHVRDMLVRIRTVAAQLFEPDHVAWSVDAEDPVLDVALTSNNAATCICSSKRRSRMSVVTPMPSFVGVRIAWPRPDCASKSMMTAPQSRYRANERETVSPICGHGRPNSVER